MNRVILSVLPVLLAAAFSVGCAVEQSSDGTTDNESVAEFVGVGNDGDERSTKRPPNRKLNADGSEGCTSCGPLPDPWTTMGPLPDPWQSKPPGNVDPNAPPTSSSSGSGGTPHKDK